MNTALRRLGLAGALILPLGCNAEVTEKGAINTSGEMTAEEKAEEQKQMEESFKRMPKSQAAQYRKILNKNKKKTE